MTPLTQQRTVKLSVASLSLLVSLQCNVYDASLLGVGGSSVGGRVTTGNSGASGATGGANAAGKGGVAGDSEGESGAPGAGFGGLSEMAGAMETGGDGASGGSAGNVEGGAGTGTGGTAGAVGGAGGAVGGAGGAQAASGCAKLSVPFDAATDKAHFVISLTTPVDMSGATISMRFYVQAGVGGSLFNYVQDSGTYHFLGVPGAQRRLLSSSSGWSTVSWDVGAEPDAAGTGIVKTSIKNIGIELNAQPSAAWSNPTIVYVDSLSVTTPSLSFTFDVTGSVNPTPTATNPSGEVLWSNSGSSDTTATGATLSWQATCP